MQKDNQCNSSKVVLVLLVAEAVLVLLVVVLLIVELVLVLLVEEVLILANCSGEDNSNNNQGIYIRPYMSSIIFVLLYYFYPSLYK